MAYTSPDVYFAADESKRLVERLGSRAVAYREWLSRTGRSSRMQRAWSAYYGGSVDGQKDAAGILRGGQQGELALLTANVFGTMVRQVMRLITGQKPAFKVVAKSSDSESIAQAFLGDALIDAYDRKLRVTEGEVDAVQSGMLLGNGFVALSWATQLGREVGLDPDTDKVIREGDVQMRVLTPWDVVHDIQDAPESRQWIVLRVVRKRFDLIAQFPRHADKIRSSRGDAFVSADRFRPDGGPTRWDAPPNVDSDTEDNVVVWEFRHIPTPALPNGRLAQFISSDCVLFDSMTAGEAAPPQVGEDGMPLEADTGPTDAGYPYPGLLVEEYAPERRTGRPAETHTSHWDAMSLQEMLDVVTSAIATNANIGALVNMWVPQGGVPNLHKLDTGLNIIESNIKPEVLDLLHMPQELVGLGQVLQDFMQQISGLNNVVMGDTPKGMPAQLAALLEAKAVQFHAQGQAGYYRLVETVRTSILKLLQSFTKKNEPRVTSIAGKANTWMLQSWTAEDISGLDRVAVEPVNPVMRTFAGRMTLAEGMADRGWIGKDEFLATWLTGETKTQMDPRQATIGRHAREKEMLMRGIGLPPIDMAATQQALMLDPGAGPVFTDDGRPHIRPLATDKHWLDIPEYLSVLESPEARENPAVVQAVTDVVQEKLRLWQTMSPDILALLGGQPPPSAMMAMGPPPMPEGDGRGAPKAAAIAGEADADVNLPKPPENPLTGEQAPAPIEPNPTMA